MRHLIRSAAHWVSLVLAPGTGRHRAGVRPDRQPRPTLPPVLAAPLPAHRSAYGLDLPLDGTESHFVRPYLRHLVGAGGMGA